jgi:hydrogenase maturation protease
LSTTGDDRRMPPDQEPSRVLILGIGNLLWADEGFGVRCVEALHARCRFPSSVRVMDGGTQGMFLLGHVLNSTHLLLFDAIDFGLAPGSLRVIRDDQVPSWMGAKKMSMHQTGFQEVLAAARLMERLPRGIALVGVQPERLDDYGGSLRPAVKARIPAALEAGLDVLRGWGIDAVERAEPLPEHERIGPASLDMDPYEAQRPHLRQPART